jgi:hypothetical protein
MKDRLLIIFSFLLILTGCEKDEKRIFLEGGTAPVLTATKTGNIPISFATKDEEAIKLTWTNPDYQLTTGLSSQNVTYLVEIDTLGANFTNPRRKIISISNDMNLSITNAQLNDYLLNQLELDLNKTHTLQIRVKSTMGIGAAPLFSNILQLTAKPYAIPPKVNPPATGKLFIVGSATPGGWNNPVPVPSQEFTKVSPTLYQITLPLTGGGSYLLLPENGQWTKYGFTGANNSNNPDGDDFMAEGGDLISPPASGNYKIEVNFQTGKFKLTKL